MYTEIVILATLQSQPRHGYEIKKIIERSLGRTIAIHNTLLYPTLKRFEALGAVRRELQRQEGRPDRHIYHLTEQGRAMMLALLRTFTPEMAENNEEFFTRVAFFELLEPEARLHILNIREAALAARLAYLGKIEQWTESSESLTYAQQVLQLQQQKEEQELAWLHNLMTKTQQVATYGGERYEHF